MVIISVTSLLAIPFGLWVNSLWVNEMAYHASIDSSIILPTVTIIVMIAAVTIVSQVWINANKNPTENTKSGISYLKIHAPFSMEILVTASGISWSLNVFFIS